MSNTEAMKKKPMNNVQTKNTAIRQLEKSKRNIKDYDRAWEDDRL